MYMCMIWFAGRLYYVEMAQWIVSILTSLMREIPSLALQSQVIHSFWFRLWKWYVRHICTYIRF